MSDTATIRETQTPEQPLGTVEVLVRHQGHETRVIGTPDGVIRELLAYFAKLYPSLELTTKIVLTIDNAEFLQSCAGIIASSPEGVVVLKNADGLKDKELMMLHIAGARLAHILAKKDTDTLALEEITKATGRSMGTVAGRLSELHREQLVERVGKGSYRLTTIGARTVMRNLMPRMAAFPDR